jgi:hypothetical protein
VYRSSHTVKFNAVKFNAVEFNAVESGAVKSGVVRFGALTAPQRMYPSRHPQPRPFTSDPRSWLGIFRRRRRSSPRHARLEFRGKLIELPRNIPQKGCGAAFGFRSYFFVNVAAKSFHLCIDPAANLFKFVHA